MSRTIALALAVSSSLAAPSPPFWGPTWTAPFNQTIIIHQYSWNDTVHWMYDSTTLPVGSSLYAHSRGQNDEICTAVKGHETSEEPCILLMSTDKWRRVIYPDTGECCKVCNTGDYCGIVRPDWLQTNATYEGEQTIAGLDCEGFMKEGGEQNFYYAEKTTQQPCLYYEGYPILPATSNYWYFEPSLFSRAAIPASTFAPPAGCDSMCAMSETTYAQRLASRAAAGVGGNLLRVSA